MSRVADLKVKIFADGADYEGIVKMSKNPAIKGFTTILEKAVKAGARLMKPIFDVPNVGRIAMTAPATPQVTRDIGLGGAFIAESGPVTIWVNPGLSAPSGLTATAPNGSWSLPSALSRIRAPAA